MKNYEFKNLREFREEDFKEYANDIIIDGKSIFESKNTPEQDKVIETAIKLVDDHCRGLGIEKKSFDKKRVILQLPTVIRRIVNGEYSDADVVLLREDCEANLPLQVHELIHAYSSEWSNYEHAELEEWIKDIPRGVKSGFHTVWKQPVNEKKQFPIQVNFMSINEGITEKIAIDIMQTNIKEYEKLKPLFKGRLEERLRDIKTKYDVELSELSALVNQLTEQLLVQIKVLEIKKKMANLEFDNLIEKENNLEIKDELSFEKSIKISDIDSSIESLKLRLHYTTERISDFNAWYEAEIEELKTSYSFSLENRASYSFEKKIVDLLIEGLANSSEFSDQKITLEERKKLAWVELQKAYFSGKTVFLRKLEQVFGKGFLRELSEIGQLLTAGEREEQLSRIKKLLPNSQ